MKKTIERACPVCRYTEFRDAEQISLFFMDVCPKCGLGRLEKIGQIIYKDLLNEK